MAVQFRLTKVHFFVSLTCFVLVTQTCGQDVQCGKRSLPIVPLIVDGRAAKLEHWPWHAAVFHEIEEQFKYMCGGSIIGRNSILTAGHCVDVSKNKISVHVGRERLDQNSTYLQILTVLRIVTHPEYNPKTVEHDIAILKLTSDIIMTELAHPVCVWNLDEHENPINGTNGTVVGFGTNKNDKPSEILLQATLTVVDVYDCLGSAPDAFGKFLKRTMYCAGQPGVTSTCKGDSGGGMFFLRNGKWYVRGIVSFIALITDQCESSNYTVFTDVSKYQDWIHQHIDLKPDGLQNLKSCNNRIPVNDEVCNFGDRYGHDFLIAGTSLGLTRVEMNGKQPLPIFSTEETPLAIDVDCFGGRIYWAGESGGLFSANYNLGDQQRFPSEAIRRSNGVAVDWISRRLYWTDSNKHTIEVASLENPHNRALMVTHLSSPSKIAVDPYRGKLYWVDVIEYTQGIIEWSNLDGSERQVLVGGPQISRPNDIQILKTTGELCWVDSETLKIECIDTTSKLIRTVVDDLEAPYGLASTYKRFYWTDFITDRIESINLDGERQEHINMYGLKNSSRDYAYALTAVTANCTLVYSPCALYNGNCPSKSLCMPSPNEPSGKICIFSRDPITVIGEDDRY